MRNGSVLLTAIFLLAGAGLAQQSGDSSGSLLGRLGEAFGSEMAVDGFSPGQEQAIAQVAVAGGVVRLGEGEFVFPEGWFLSEDLQLTGAGRGETIVTFTAPVAPDDGAVMWDGAGTLAIRDLTLRLVSSEAGSVMEAGSGSVVFENVIVRGAVSKMMSERGETAIRAGNGVVLYGAATADLTNVLLTGNAAAGLLVSGTSRGRLAESTVSDNGYNGVRLQGDSMLVLEGNLVTGNEIAGISVAGSARPTVTGNELTGNAGDGLAVSEGQRHPRKWQEWLSHRRRIGR